MRCVLRKFWQRGWLVLGGPKWAVKWVTWERPTVKGAVVSMEWRLEWGFERKKALERERGQKRPVLKRASGSGETVLKRASGSGKTARGVWVEEGVVWFASGAPLGISVEGSRAGASVLGGIFFGRVWGTCIASLVPPKITIRECLDFLFFLCCCGRGLQRSVWEKIHRNFGMPREKRQGSTPPKRRGMLHVRGKAERGDLVDPSIY